jgi:hypothetical protein
MLEICGKEMEGEWRRKRGGRIKRVFLISRGGNKLGDLGIKKFWFFCSPCLSNSLCLNFWTLK